MIFFLPFFLSVLIIKNVESWLRIAMEAFGAEVIILIAVLLNFSIGLVVYQQLQYRHQLKTQVELLEQKVTDHKSFWNTLHQEFPEHAVVNDALKTLEK